jgi:SAM-dependent methyltransferase
VLARLADELAGAVRLAYLDPPFGTGTQFLLGPGRRRGEAGPAPEPAYRDLAPDPGAWLAFMDLRLQLARQLLAPDGTLVLHVDPRLDWAARGLIDAVFGPGHIINQIIWHYTGGGRSKRYFSRKHDVLYWVARGRSWTFRPDAVRQPYRRTSGYARGGIVARSGKRYLPHPEGTPVDDVWHLPIVNPRSPERLGYPTQKPERLLHRLLAATTDPGDLVLDPFSGSGTTAAVAERLGRRWLAIDASPAAVRITRERLMSWPDVRPFDELEVGGHHR